MTLILDRTLYIGDPHLGKKFINGVPLHRRGEREELQANTFEQLLIVPHMDYIVIVGDLFDTFKVSNEVLIRTYESLMWASGVINPTGRYVILKGNHDLSRNSLLVSSFDILEHLIGDSRDNITFVSKEPKAIGDFLFVPYHAFMTGKEVLDKYISENPDKTFDTVVGHWDMETFGGKEPHNLIPREQLENLARNRVVTGHYHKPETRNWGPIDVTVTGSMLPYAHGEERSDEPDPMYITVPLAELEEKLLLDPETYAAKCVRVLMEPNEELPSFNALHISKKLAGSSDSPDEEIQVDLMEFNLGNLLIDCLSSESVGEEFSTEAQEIFYELINQGE